MDYLTSILIEYGLVGIIIAAFSEAVFLPMPMEVIAIPVYLASPDKAIFYVAVLIIVSLIGSVTGYHLIQFLSKSFKHKFMEKEKVQKVKDLYDKNAFLTLITSAFTPVPYEVYVLSAGIFEINFKTFLFATVVSRILRHLPQAILIRLYGDAILSNLKTYTFVAALIVFIVLVSFKYLQNKIFNYSNR